MIVFADFEVYRNLKGAGIDTRLGSECCKILICGWESQYTCLFEILVLEPGGVEVYLPLKCNNATY